MRLIDADALIKHLNDYALQESFSRDMKSTYTYRTILECIKAAEEAPTAFDKEKVIKGLRSEIHLTVYDPMISGRYIKKERAIEIVEKGGIE